MEQFGNPYESPKTNPTPESPQLNVLKELLQAVQAQAGSLSRAELIERLESIFETNHKKDIAQMGILGLQAFKFKGYIVDEAQTMEFTASDGSIIKVIFAIHKDSHGQTDAKRYTGRIAR